MATAHHGGAAGAGDGTLAAAPGANGGCNTGRLHSGFQRVMDGSDGEAAASERTSRRVWLSE